MSQTQLNAKITQKPRHVALVMDGNGRWAKARGLERYEGHAAGVQALRETLKAASKLGIEYLTAYTFSLENWNRPADEINALMMLLVKAINEELVALMDNKVRLMAIGDLERLPQEARSALEACINETAQNEGICLILALSYSSRWELTDAAKRLASKIEKKELKANEINESHLEAMLQTAQLPPLDLFIRTGGEKRLSNFLLWQAAYAELYFTDTLWPDFGADELEKALVDFGMRERRFGRISEQIEQLDTLE